MSETICKCGYPIRFLEAEKEEDGRPAMWIHTGGYGRQCPIYAEPNEHCDYCFTVKPCVLEDSSGRMMCQDCLDKAAASTDAPAVPAQEAPQAADIRWVETPGGNLKPTLRQFEPQAGAQELFPGANDMRAPTGMENLRDTPPIVYEGNMAFAQFVGVIEEAEQAGAQVPSRPDWCVWCGGPHNSGECEHAPKQSTPAQETPITHPLQVENAGLSQVVHFLETKLAHITAYATEAAKTPITREDMHDPLKAQTFYDEHEGFIRLVLSEIGGGK